MTISFVIVALIAAAVAVLGIANTRLMAAASARSYQQVTLPLSELLVMTEDFQKIRIAGRDIITADSPDQIKGINEEIAGLRRELDEVGLGFDGSILTELGRFEMDRFAASKARYFLLLDRVIAYAVANRDAEANAIISGSGREASLEAQTALETLVQSRLELARASSAADAQRARDLTILAIVASLAAIGVALLFGVLLSRRVTLPLEEANTRLGNSIEEKDRLMKELAHRVKNSLATVGNILSLESGQAPDEHSRLALEEAQGRVVSIAELYDLLLVAEGVSTVDIGEYIERIVHHLRGIFLQDGRRIEIFTDCVDLSLGSGLAAAIGYCCNELVTNSIKYAFADGREGMIVVTVRHVEGRLKVGVKDNGLGLPGGSPPAPGTGGLGFILVRALVEQHGGSLRIDGRNGSSVELDFPFRG